MYLPYPYAQRRAACFTNNVFDGDQLSRKIKHDPNRFRRRAMQQSPIGKSFASHTDRHEPLQQGALVRLRVHRHMGRGH